jgi:hypothetical protein
MSAGAAPAAAQPVNYLFGGWKPDVPHILNPAFGIEMKEFFTMGEVSMLEAQNVFWTARGWRPYKPLNGTIAAPVALLNMGVSYNRNGTVQIYGGSAYDLWQIQSGAWVKVSRTTPAWEASNPYTSGTNIVDSNGRLQKCTTSGTSGTTAPTWGTTIGAVTDDGGAVWTCQSLGAYSPTTNWSFQGMTGCMYATNGINQIQSIDMDTGTAFADIGGGAPICSVLGMIRDFLFAGNIQSAQLGNLANGVQWSAISLPASWPAPGTQTAYADQAGAQTVYSEYGPVMAISDNESFGLIFQETGIVRAEYVGGSVVFQFYTYEKKRGAVGPQAVARVGNKYYFCSPDGFFMTDGQTVDPIGYKRVDNWFFDRVGNLGAVQACADTRNKLVYFTYPSEGSAYNDSVLIYNYVESVWSFAEQDNECIAQGIVDQEYVPVGVDLTNSYGSFDGTPGTATLTSQDLQLQQNGRSVVTMVRAMTDGNPLVAIGSRNQVEQDSVFTPYYAAHQRSGVAGVRSEGVYHRVSVELTGTWSDCVGATVYYKNAGIL